MPSKRGLEGDFAGVDREGLLGRGLEEAAIGRVADQRLVTLLELPLGAVEHGGPVGGVLVGLGLVAANDIAAAFHLLDPELGWKRWRAGSPAR
jgi:hypothetical protein